MKYTFSIILGILFAFLLNTAYAQKFKINWNSKPFTSKQYGTFYKVCGGNDKFFYALFHKKQEKTIIAFDTEAQTEVARYCVTSHKEYKVLKRAILEDVYIAGETVYLFFSTGKKTKKYYVQTSTSYFGELSEPEYIGEYTRDSEEETKTVKFNPKLSTNLFLFITYIGKSGEEQLFYSCITPDGVPVKNGDIPLGIKRPSGRGLLYFDISTSNIQVALSANGNIVGRSIASLPKSQKVNNGEFGKSINNIFIIDTATNVLKTQPLLFKDYHVYNSYLHSDSTGVISVFAYASLKNDDPKAERVQGILQCQLNDLNFESLKYQKFQNKAWENLPTERPKTETEVPADPELDHFMDVSSLIIEQIGILPNGRKVILGSSFSNYVLPSSSTSKCAKSGLITLIIDSLGNTVFFDYLPRYWSYFGSGIVYDIDYFVDESNLYVFFGDIADSRGNSNENKIVELIEANEQDIYRIDLKTYKTKRDFVKFDKKNTIALHEAEFKKNVLLVSETSKIKVWVWFTYPIIAVTALPAGIVLFAIDAIANTHIIDKIGEADFYKKSKVYFGVFHPKDALEAGKKSKRK